MVVGSECECGLCLLVLSVLWFVSVGLRLVIVLGFGLLVIVLGFAPVALELGYVGFRLWCGLRLVWWFVDLSCCLCFRFGLVDLFAYLLDLRLVCLGLLCLLGGWGWFDLLRFGWDCCLCFA